MRRNKYMLLKKSQVDAILKNAPAGVDKSKILDSLILKGYDLEGVDSNEIKAKLAAQQAQPPEKKETFVDTIKDAAVAGYNKAKEGHAQARDATNPLQLLEGSVKLAAGVADTVFSPFAPITKPLEKGFNKSIDEISDNPAIQKFAGTKAGEITARVAEDVANTSTIAGAVAGAMETPKIGTAIANKTESVVNAVGTKVDDATNSIKNTTGNVINDLRPSAEGVVNEVATKALYLAPSDVANIFKSTGNKVGNFLAEHNLIKENIKTTTEAIGVFFKENYDLVRSEIGKVKNTYKIKEVPRYHEALMQLKKSVSDVPGMQEIETEVNALLKNKKPTLADVQRVKELVDDNYSLYKVTGDVKESIAKEGMSNIRQELRSFIETEVKNNTGTDIFDLNNKVSTAKSIMNAIETRSPKGVTKANLQVGDLGAFGLGMSFGGPLVGVAALIAKKLTQNPSVMLRFAKWVDALSDARKLKVAEALKSGKIPPEVQEIVGPIQSPK